MPCRASQAAQNKCEKVDLVAARKLATEATNARNKCDAELAASKQQLTAATTARDQCLVTSLPNMRKLADDNAKARDACIKVDLVNARTQASDNKKLAEKCASDLSKSQKETTDS
jgi:hypothetical protein